MVLFGGQLTKVVRCRGKLNTLKINKIIIYTYQIIFEFYRTIASIGTKKIAVLAAIVSIMLIIIICISISSNQSSNQSQIRPITTKMTTTSTTMTKTTKTATTITTTTTKVAKSTTIHTPVQCDTLRGNNVEWIDGTQYDLGCLGYVKSTKPFQKAETFCASLDSHLVEIFNQNQQDFIKQKAQQFHNSFWIGLKRFDTTWKWINSNQQPNYTAWSPGEPHNNGRTMAVMYRSYDYNWVDVHGNIFQSYSICQVTNQTVIDALDVPIAPHQINDTGTYIIRMKNCSEMTSIISILGTCIESNSHVNKLKGTSSIHVDGWNIHIQLITKTNIVTTYYDRCKNLGGPKDFWAGCCGGKIISTTLYGCGHAKLNVGNCQRHSHVRVYLDGKFIGDIPSQTNSKVFEFAFKEGSILKINDGGGIIKFNNFEVTDCNCGD